MSEGDSGREREKETVSAFEYARLYVLQCVEVCCSVSQRVAERCSVLQCAATCRSALQCFAVCEYARRYPWYVIQGGEDS